jgi:hypothetical protein
MRSVSVAEETALAFKRMPPSAPLKMLIDELAVVAELRGNQATFALETACKSSTAPSTVYVKVPLLLPVTAQVVNFALIQSRLTPREMPDDDSVTRTGIPVKAPPMTPNSTQATTLVVHHAGPHKTMRFAFEMP